MTTSLLVPDSMPPAAGPQLVRDEMSHLAHDLNNLLAVIVGHADALEITLPEAAADRASLAAIRDAARAASELAERVRKTGRPPAALAPSATHVERVVHATGLALGLRLRNRVSVTVQAAPHLWMASVDATLLDDSVTAIVTQVAGLVPHGATVRIRLANAELGVNRPHLVGSIRRARFVRVEIAVPEAAERLRLTRPVGSAPPASTADVCLAALAAGGARVSIDSDGVCASLVSLLLPSDALEARDAAETPVAALPARPALPTIVVLDGDGARRALLLKILRAQGFDVRPAASESDVAAFAGACGADLCITDRPFVWPHFGAAAVGPAVVYTGRAAVSEGAFGPAAATLALPTPFGAAQLVAAVRAVLGPASGAAAPMPVPVLFKGGAGQPNLIEEHV